MIRMPNDRLVRFQHPAGVQGRVLAHRTHANPDGGLTSETHVVRRDVVMVTKELPVSFDANRPEGSRGPWVQISPADTGLGLLHAAGVAPRRVQVLRVGKRTAVVRDRLPEKKVKVNAPVQRSTVSTRGVRGPIRRMFDAVRGRVTVDRQGVTIRK